MRRLSKLVGIIAVVFLVAAGIACGGDDDSDNGDAETATEAASGVEASVIQQTVDLLAEEPRNEFDPGDMAAKLVTYAEAYEEITSEAPGVFGALASPPPGNAWLVRANGTFIYTTTCPAEGCEPAPGSYFFIFNEQGQLGQGIFVSDK